MVIDTINQDHVDGSVFQGARCSQTPKASTNDHHYASLVGHSCLTSGAGLLVDSCRM